MMCDKGDRHPLKKPIPLLFLILLLLSACSAGNQGLPSETTLTASETPALPTDTAVPPPLVVLLAPPETDAHLLAQIQPVLEAAAAENGLRLEVHQALDPAALPLDLQLVVAAAPSPNLPQLIAAAPQTQFIALMIPGLTAAPNLTEISGGSQSALNQGFIAGYSAAALTDDYRVGAITSFSEPGYGKGFSSGVRFFCGLCPQLYPPFYDYPLSAEINPKPSPAEWQAAADQLIASSVLTIFVAPDVGDAALFDYLAQKGVNYISGVTPPQSAAKNCLLTIQYDLPAALQQNLPAILQSGSLGQLSVAISLRPSDSELVGPGHIDNFNQVIDELQQGIIDPGY